MPVGRNKFQLTVQPGAYLLAALWLLVLPLRWCGAAAAAAAIHELFHCMAVYLSGGEIWGGAIGPGGAVIRAAPMSRGRMLVCALAGPLGGALTAVLLVRCCPRIAFCGVVQTAWNLLPLGGLDGGQALRCGAELLFSEAAAQRLCKGAAWATAAMAVGMGIYGTFFAGLGLLPLVLAGILFLRMEK